MRAPLPAFAQARQQPLVSLKNVRAPAAWAFQKWCYKKAASLNLTIEQFKKLRAEKRMKSYYKIKRAAQKAGTA